MTLDDAYTIAKIFLAMSIVPAIVIGTCFQGDIRAYFRNEEASLRELNSGSFETRKLAVYLEKLDKVYSLCIKLHIDDGNYFGLSKKVLSEIEYVERQLQTQVGKDCLDKFKEGGKSAVEVK